MNRKRFLWIFIFVICAYFYGCSEDGDGGLNPIKDVRIKDTLPDSNTGDDTESLDTNEDSGDTGIEDVLVDVCKPDCNNKQCGDDGCGGSCGSCGQNAECIDNQCKCVRKYDNCNSDWSDGCEVNFYTDPNNCGKCNYKCNVLNVKTVLCEDMLCSYDECLPPYVDGDLDKKNGCEMYSYYPFRYGTVAHESGRGIVQTRDKGFLFIGTTNYRGNTDFFINKSDEYGNTIWQRVIGGDKEDMAISIVENEDGDILAGGYSDSFGVGKNDIWLILMDAAGNIKWQKTYGSVNDDRLFAMKSVSDGYVIVGTYNSSCVTCSAIWVFKIDKNGDFIWQKQFGGNNDSGAFNLDISPSSGDILISGAINTGCQTCYDAFYLRLRPDGSKVYAKQIGDPDNIERGYSIVGTDDNGAIVGGEVPVSGNVLDTFLMKFDSSGGVAWQRTYGGPDNQKPYQLIRTVDNNFLLLGETMFYGSGQYDCILIKVDKTGNAIYQKTYGGDKIDRCYSVFPTLDKGFIFIGESYSFDTSLELIVYKTDKDGNSLGVCPEGFGKSVSLKINPSSIQVKDMNIQVADVSAAITNTSAFVDISGITSKMLCKEK